MEQGCLKWGATQRSNVFRLVKEVAGSRRRKEGEGAGQSARKVKSRVCGSVVAASFEIK